MSAHLLHGCCPSRRLVTEAHLDCSSPCQHVQSWSMKPGLLDVVAPVLEQPMCNVLSTHRTDFSKSILPMLHQWQALLPLDTACPVHQLPYDDCVLLSCHPRHCRPRGGRGHSSRDQSHALARSHRRHLPATGGLHLIVLACSFEGAFCMLCCPDVFA